MRRLVGEDDAGLAVEGVILSPDVVFLWLVARSDPLGVLPVVLSGRAQRHTVDRDRARPLDASRAVQLPELALGQDDALRSAAFTVPRRTAQPNG